MPEKSRSRDFLVLSVKYTMNKGTTKAFDLKFLPEVDNGNTRCCAKFQVGRSQGSDFTDWFVFCPIFTQIIHFLDNGLTD